MKRFSLITLFLLTTLLSVSAFVVDEFEFTILDAETNSVSVKRNNAYDYSGIESLTIPATITYDDQTYNVTEIAFEGFRDLRAEKGVPLKEINLPEGLKAIGGKAFVGLYDIQGTTIIPSTVDTIGEYAFADWVTPIQFLSEVPAALGGTQVFRDNLGQNSSIIIPCGTYNAYSTATEWKNWITRIVDPCYLTFEVESLKYKTEDGVNATLLGYAGKAPATISIPNIVSHNAKNYVVRKIGSMAFKDSTTIGTLIIGDSIIEIGASAFYNCTGLQSITFGSNLRTIRDRAFVGCTALQDTVIIPATVSVIEEYAFAEWQCPIKILSETPATLGTQVFRDNNTKASSIILPCGTLEAYKAEAGWNSYVSRMKEECLTFNDGILCYSVYPDNDTLVKTIGFADGKDTANIVIPNKVNYADHNYIVQSIDKSAFINCSTIETVVLGDSIIEIGASAFYNCKGLQSITFGSNLRTIRDRAFVGCTALQDTVIIPATVSLIEEYAFAEWECPISILSETPATLGTEVFRDNNKKASHIILPCGKLETYKIAQNWSSFSSRFVSACKPLKLTKGEALTQNTIVSSIAFSRTFPMNLWQELYLPFKVDEVLVYDSDDRAYYDINVPFDSTKNAGYFYLYGLKNVDMEAGSITFQEVHKLEGFTPYLILFINKNSDYFEGKEVVFTSKQYEYSLTDNYTEPSLTPSYQLHGNKSLWEHSLADGFTLSSSYENGQYKFHFDYNENAPILPFSWVVTPTKDIASKIMPAPRFLAGRWGNQSSGGDVTTSMQNTSNNSLTYTQSGSLLTLHTQGQPCKVYAIDGTLLLSTNGSQEEVSIELDKGMYIIYSNGHSQKVLF